MNDWLNCPDIAVWYEVAAVASAHQAFRQGQQAARETAAAIAAETAPLRKT